MKTTHDTFRIETQIIHAINPAERRAHGMIKTESNFGEEALVTCTERICGFFTVAVDERKFLCWAKEI